MMENSLVPVRLSQVTYKELFRETADGAVLFKKVKRRKDGFDVASLHNSRTLPKDIIKKRLPLDAVVFIDKPLSEKKQEVDLYFGTLSDEEIQQTLDLALFQKKNALEQYNHWMRMKKIYAQQQQLSQQNYAYARSQFFKNAVSTWSSIIARCRQHLLSRSNEPSSAKLSD